MFFQYAGACLQDTEKFRLIMMLDEMKRRHVVNGELVIGDFVWELETAIDAFEEFYADYQPSKYSIIAYKMSVFAGIPNFINNPSKCFLSYQTWNNSVDFASIQLSISNKYAQVLDYSMFSLLNGLCE